MNSIEPLSTFRSYTPNAGYENRSNYWKTLDWIVPLVNLIKSDKWTFGQFSDADKRDRRCHRKNWSVKLDLIEHGVRDLIFARIFTDYLCGLFLLTGIYFMWFLLWWQVWESGGCHGKATSYPRSAQLPRDGSCWRRSQASSELSILLLWVQVIRADSALAH